MAARQWPAGSFATARLTAATPADPVGPKCRFDRHPRRPAAGCVVADRGFVDAVEPVSPRFGKATAPSSMRPEENLRLGSRPEKLPGTAHRPPPDPATASAERHVATCCVVRVRTTSPQPIRVRPRLNEAALCPVRLTSKKSYRSGPRPGKYSRETRFPGRIARTDRRFSRPDWVPSNAVSMYPHLQRRIANHAHVSRTSIPPGSRFTIRFISRIVSVARTRDGSIVASRRTSSIDLA